MPGRGPADLDRRLAELHDGASALAAALAERAAGHRTAGQERALLRLLGVTGLDAADRPLAAEVVERFVGGGPDRLADGIILPFSVALLEYDLAPQSLALDVASGAVDLSLESELLHDAERRAVAESEARRLVASGVERIDANRVARRELVDVLGDPPRPWVGTTLTERLAQQAAVEARTIVRDGADLLRVEVPSGRELSARLHALGAAAAAIDAGARLGRSEDVLMDAPPSGSQRGLAALRTAIDTASAERSAYIRLATTTPALSAPEAAVVAALERVDLVASDPIEEIVTVGVDPDRVLADHGFARRLLRRAGAAILVGPGPLVVAPDLARGLPSNPAVRAGRALALQLLGVRLAIAQGMAPDQVIMEVVPGWLLGEPAPYTRAAAEIALRRALLPDCPLAFAEPSEPSRAQAWAFLLGAVLPPAPAAALILRAPSDGAFAATALATRAAAAVAAEVGAARQPAQLHGLALQHALATTVVATETIEQLRSHGWTAVIGEGMTGQLDSGGWIGRGPASVARSRSPFDPLGDALGHPLGPGVAPAR